VTNLCGGCGTEIITGENLCNKCLEFSQDGHKLRPPLVSGTVINEKYIIKELVKAGIMSRVYRAEDKVTEDICAVKELCPFEDALEKEKEYTVSKVINEYNLLYEFDDLRIPGVKEYFIVDENCYLTMDFIEGKNLQETIKTQGKPGLPVKEVVDWGIQLCEVLEYMHNYNPPIIYRDLKPSNIMLRNSDRIIMLIDFSIACPFFENLSDIPRTKIGTVGFMPPEQFLVKISPSSDLFALGATLYYLLSGELQVLYSYKPINTIIPEVPYELDAIIRRSLRVKPEDRFRSAGEMKIALETFLKSDVFATKEIGEVDLWIGEIYATEKKRTKLEAINTLDRFPGYQRVTRCVRDILLNDTDGDCRQAAARVAGSLGDPNFIEALVEKTRDKNINVRMACIESLSNFSSLSVLKCLVSCLKDKNGTIRKAAALSLEKLGDERALEALKEAKEKEGFFSLSTRKAIDKAIQKLETCEEKDREDEENLSFFSRELLDTDSATDQMASDEFEYKEKDKIYLKLIYDLLNKGSELSIALILQNKSKLDERFFDLLDYEYSIISEKNPQKVNDLTYLMQVMENLRVPERISPPYEPSTGELEELSLFTFEEIKNVNIETDLDVVIEEEIAESGIIIEEKPEEIREIIIKRENTKIEGAEIITGREKEEVYDSEETLRLIQEEEDRQGHEETEPANHKQETDLKKELPSEIKQFLWKKAEKEFPDNRMMQEYYYFNLMQEYLAQERSIKRKTSTEYRYKITEKTLINLPDDIDINKLKFLLGKLLEKDEYRLKLFEAGFSEEKVQIILNNLEKIKVKKYVKE